MDEKQQAAAVRVAGERHPGCSDPWDPEGNVARVVRRHGGAAVPGLAALDLGPNDVGVVPFAVWRKPDGTLANVSPVPDVAASRAAGVLVVSPSAVSFVPDDPLPRLGGIVHAQDAGGHGTAR